MLKPKRKITIKEIKQDPLLETIFKGQQYFNENKRLITRIGGGILLVVTVLILFRSNRSSASTEADDILASAMSHYQAGNHSKAIADLDMLINQYSSTKSGETALYYLAHIQMDAGNDAEVWKYAESYARNGLSPSHRAGAYQMLGELNEKEGDYSGAANNYVQAANFSGTEILSRRNLLRAVDCYLKNGNLDKADALIIKLEPKDDSLDQLRGELIRIKSKYLVLKSNL
ncbi:MAG: tetratricopeptide repeat protein [Candidatus Marinimicrobia bacterium]|jgi:outer membrane protein assembly factor BamD (BamD/ComL family)|nr:tetratricopeptide repeat protein [Candidatus Neomarinimicrobiota bacterium]